MHSKELHNLVLLEAYHYCDQIEEAWMGVAYGTCG